MTALRVQQLALRARALPDEAVTFTVEAGKISALFGRPGSGIREVLRVIAGLDPAASGEIRLDDSPIQGLPVHRRRIGLVQRDSTLFPGTVEDNVAFGLKRAGWPKSDRGRRIAEVLELVGMTGAEGDRTDILTEGERARVVLARAIAPKPSALLVEAPTWFVPEVDRIAFRGRLREVFQSLDIPIVISTNDVQDAVGIADDLLVVHEGVLRQSGSVSRVLAGPSSIEVAELVGYVTLIRGEVKDGWILEPGAGAIDFPAGFPLQGTARALGHPAVMLGVPDDSGLGCGVSGTLERVRAIGPTHLLDIRVGERTIEVRWEWDLNPPEPDAIIAIAVTPGTLRFFNEPNTPRPAASAEPSDAMRTEDATLPSVATAGAPALADAEAGETPTEDETGTDLPRSVTAAAPETPETPEAPEAPPEEPSRERPQEPAAPATPREFTPSEGLMAEPPPPRVEPTTVAYEPEERLREESGATFIGSGAPAPAPSPPRTRVEEAPPTSEDVEHAEERADDDSVGAMAPWLQVSRPPRAGDDENAPPKPDPHRGMPLD